MNAFHQIAAAALRAAHACPIMARTGLRGRPLDAQAPPPLPSRPPARNAMNAFHQPAAAAPRAAHEFPAAARAGLRS
ncbi:MAG: hypothetical protein OD918_11220, partial [Gammaproteobacteria bacterium]